MDNNPNPARPMATVILIVTAMLAAAPLLPIHAYDRTLPPPITALAEEEKEKVSYFTETDVSYLKQCVWAEARGSDLTGQSMVVWCVLNRLDAGGFGKNITGVITAPKQFAYGGGDKSEQFDWIVRDVLTRWVGEKTGETRPEKSGRTLPPEYLYFCGDGKVNHYTKQYKRGAEYDGSLGTPYDGGY